MTQRSERYEITPVDAKSTEVVVVETEENSCVRPAFMKALVLEFKVQEDLRFLKPSRATTLLAKYIVKTYQPQSAGIAYYFAKDHPLGAVALGLAGLAMGAKTIASYKDYTTDAEQFPHALFLLIKLNEKQISELNYTVTGGLVKLLSSSLLYTFDTRLEALNKLNNESSEDVIQMRRTIYSEGLAEGMTLLSVLQTHLEKLVAAKNKLIEEKKQLCREEIERVKLEQAGLETMYKAGLLPLGEYTAESQKLSKRKRSAQFSSFSGAVSKHFKNADLLMLESSDADSLTAEKYCEKFYDEYRQQDSPEFDGSFLKGIVSIIVASLLILWAIMHAFN